MKPNYPNFCAPGKWNEQVYYTNAFSITKRRLVIMMTSIVLMLAVFYPETKVHSQPHILKSAPGGKAFPDTASLMVHYKFSHVRDSNNRSTPYMENMVLLLGKNSSAYKSYDKQLEDAIFKKQVQEQMANSPDGRIMVNRKSSASGTQFYQFPAEKKLIRKEPLIMNEYLIEEDLPPISWLISSDTASFGGLLCQKATAHVKGRDYTAWFCPDLPFHTGPWKLNGLPGVILDAYDAKKEVIFQFDGLEKIVPDQELNASKDANSPKANNEPRSGGNGAMGPIMFGVDDSNTDPRIIQPPSGCIKTSEKEFSKLQEAMRKDPNAFVQSQIAASGMNGDKGPKMKMDIKPGSSPIINNPIELPEKK
jgi:GLPGLI family protein